MFVFFALVGIVYASLIQTASVSVSNYYIRKTTTVSISLALPTTIPENGQLIVVFPEDFVLDSTALCSVQQGVSNKDQTTCILSGQSFTISQCFPSVPGNLIVNFFRIPTPDYALVTDSFEIYSVSDKNLVIDSVDDGVVVEFFPVSMKMAEITVSEDSIWTIIFDCFYEVVEVLVELPQRDAYLDADGAVENSEYCEDVRCANVSNFYFEDECECVNGNLMIFGYSGGGKSVLQVQMKAPPSTDEIVGFSIYSTTAKGFVEFYDLNVTSSYIGQLSISSQSTSQELNTNSSYLLTMLCESPIPSSGQISMHFSSFSLENVEIFGIFGLNFFPNYQISNQDIKISESFSEYLPSQTELMILLNNLKNPELSNTGQIKVEIQTSTSGILCSGQIKFSIKPHWLDVNLSISDTGINQITDYNFTIQSEYFAQGYLVSIEFPDDFNIESSRCESNLKCLVNKTTVIVYEYPEFESVLSIVINNVKNPNTTKLTEQFIVSLFTNIEDLNKVCENSDIAVTPSPGVIQAEVFMDSHVVGALAVYMFQVILSNSVPEDGELIIIFPDSIKFTSSSMCEGFSSIPETTQCEFKFNTLVLSNLFIDKFHSNFQFKVTNIKNPSNTCSTESFVIQSSFNSFIIDQISTGLEIKLSTLGELDITPWLSSVTVGEIASLLLEIQSFNPLTSTLLIIFPEEFIISNSFCTKSFDNIDKIVCSQISSNSLNAALSYSSTDQYKTSFTIEDIQNPNRVVLKESIKIYTMNENCSVDSGVADLSVTQPGKLQVNFQMSNEFIGEFSNFTFDIIYMNSVPLSGYLLIYFPASIKFTVSTYCIPNCEFQDSQIRILPSSKISIFSLINSESSSEALSLNLSTYLDNFLIDTYKTGIFYFKCKSNCLECEKSAELCTLCPAGLFLYNSQCISSCPVGLGYLNNTCSECQSECKSCITSANHCTECVDGFAYNGLCVENCPMNTTIVNDNVSCSDCLPNCLTCYESIEKCSGCYEGFYLYLEQCLANCPSGYVGVKGVCRECPCSNELLNNNKCDSGCNIEACNFDNFECSSVLSVKTLPSVTAAAGSAVITSGNKFIGKGEMLGPTVALWSLTQTCSWISFSYKLSAPLTGRRLSDDLSTKQVFYLFIGIIILNLLMNIIFTSIYFIKFAHSDTLHYEWMKSHKFFITIIGILSATFSFQLIRLTYTGPTCIKCCKSPFFRISTIAKILLVYIILYTILILSPAISILVYILFSYNSSHEIYPATIDCLLLTIMIALTTVFDLVKLSIQVGSEKEKVNSSSILPNNEKVRPDETIEIRYDEQLNTDRKLRETGMTEILEPENEECERNKLRIGSFLDGNEGMEFIDFDKIDGIVLGKFRNSDEVYVIRFYGVEFDGFYGCKVIDFQDINGNWKIGRTVDEDALRDIQVYQNEKDKVSAWHIKSGYRIILHKSFIGSHMSDFPTNTPLQRTLTKSEETSLILNYEDPSYATLKENGSLYKVFRTFDNSQVIDILLEETQECEFSFSQDPKEEKKIIQSLKASQVPIEKTISGETKHSDSHNTY